MSKRREMPEVTREAMRQLKAMCVCTICPEDYGNGECQCKKNPRHPYYEDPSKTYIAPGKPRY